MQGGLSLDKIICRVCFRKRHPFIFWIHLSDVNFNKIWHAASWGNILQTL